MNFCNTKHLIFKNFTVILHDVASHNPNKIIKKFGKEALTKFGSYNIEKVAQVCRDKHTKEKPVQQIVAIVDAKKFTFKQMTSPGGMLKRILFLLFTCNFLTL